MHLKRLLATILSVVALPAFSASSDTRGYQGVMNAYRQNQRNTYYMITQPDIDSECRNRIFKCLAEYCGDTTIIPGQRSGRCMYATESDLYNYALLCIQKDRTALLPQYGANTAAGVNGMNTPARLCPSYVQSELMSYLSMANLAEKLTLSHSDECVSRRLELSAAISCHQVALAYGNGTQNRLVSQLTDVCGADMPGGSGAMVQKFATAGNLGASVLGWAEKMVSMDLSNKGPEWQSAMDQVLAYYTNRMNLACGDNMQMNTPARGGGAAGGTTNALPTLTTIANIALDTYTTRELEAIRDGSALIAPTETIWAEIRSASEVYDFATAKQVVNAGLTNSPLTQNAFLSSAQMSTMQDNYKTGAKVFVLKDSARCFIVPVRTLTSQEQSALAQVFASCAAQ
ncbi:MAG: hypothetical protein LBL21_00690 [Rickettsiales bacterium]|jgi:hypothetical protein|nr:hypothetical protein [Rickettsiales bacterium]